VYVDDGNLQIIVFGKYATSYKPCSALQLFIVR